MDEKQLDSCMQFACIHAEHSKSCIKMGRYLITHFKSICMNDILNNHKENTYFLTSLYD